MEGLRLGSWAATRWCRTTPYYRHDLLLSRDLFFGIIISDTSMGAKNSIEKKHVSYNKDSVLGCQFWNSREVLLIYSSQKQTKCSIGQMMARTIGHVTSMYSIRAPTCYSSGSRAQWLWCKPVFCQRVVGINFSWSDVAYIEDTAHQYWTKYGLCLSLQ